MSFSETIFLFVLALIVFGPKKLPEMARQAGKLLAELRRASNEFKSQIETEIAHLEVEKRQSALPASQTPPGAVASMSLNSGRNETVPPMVDAPATLAGPAPVPPEASSSASGSPAADSSGSPDSSPSGSSSSTSSAEAVTESIVSGPQESHV